MEVNEISFGLTMKAFSGQRSKWQDVCVLCTELCEKQLETNQVISGTSLASCEKGGQWMYAFYILEAYAGNGLETSTIMYNSLLSGISGAAWERASCLLFHLPVQASLISFNSVLKASGIPWFGALDLCLTLQCRGLTASIATCNTLISTCQGPRKFFDGYLSVCDVALLGLGLWDYCKVCKWISSPATLYAA
eukprot:symbB.v1.2.039272.t1/scaffold6452.1/size17978/1